jgi:hypothetical protein
MKQFTRDYVLGDLTEAEFNAWKHHPVSKLVRRFLKDRERQVAEHQIATLRGCTTSPDPYVLGQFNGHINALQELAELEFAHIVAFYPDEEEAEGQE